MPTSAETPEVLPHSLPGLGRHHRHCGVTFPRHTSTELRDDQVLHCWVHTRLSLFPLEGLQIPGSQQYGQPQDHRVLRNPLLSKRLIFLLPAYLGKVGESTVDSQLRKATGEKERLQSGDFKLPSVGILGI